MSEEQKKAPQAIIKSAIETQIHPRGTTLFHTILVCSQLDMKFISSRYNGRVSGNTYAEKVFPSVRYSKASSAIVPNQLSPTAGSLHVSDYLLLLITVFLLTVNVT
jgi:hypothetical protein